MGSGLRGKGLGQSDSSWFAGGLSDTLIAPRRLKPKSHYSFSCRPGQPIDYMDDISSLSCEAIKKVSLHPPDP